MRAHRQRLDLTIERLSAASGVSDRTISDIERGVSSGPQPRTVASLADALRLSPEERSSFLAAARAGRVVVTPPDRALTARPHRAVDFSGRRDERTSLAAMLERTSDAADTPTVIVVTGPPGVGKTTLALECLNDATEGQILFVDLQGFKVAALSPLQVLQALLRQASGGTAEQLTLDDAVVAWRNLTELAPVAVLLDNAASESQVRPVLATNGDLRVVVTSRRTLAGLEGARRVTLGPLRRDDSIAFLRRTIAARQEAVGDLDEIARFCADLPLALRIAAARIASRPQWTVEDYANRLRLEDDRMHHLVAGDLNVESTFALSYTALDAPVQSFFRSLSLLRGSSFSAVMASAIHGFDPGHGTDLLDELVDLGLVESLGGDRHRLHDLLRIFASDRLRRDESDSEVAAKRDRLQRWILDTAAAAGTSFTRDEETDGARGYRPDPAARHWLVTESDYWIDATRSAARHGQHDEVVRVVDAVLDFFGRVATGVDTLELLEIGTASARVVGDPVVLARFLHSLGDCRLRTLNDVGRARATVDEAVRIAEAIGDDRELGAAFGALSTLEASVGNYELASSLAARARDLYELSGAVDLEIRARTSMAMALAAFDRPAVRDECTRILSLLERSGLWPVTRVHALTGVARALLTIEDWDAALLVAERFVDEAKRFSDEPDFLARAYRHRGFAELGLGMLDRAHADLTAAVAIARSYAPAWWTADIDDALEHISAGTPT